MSSQTTTTNTAETSLSLILIVCIFCFQKEHTFSHNSIIKLNMYIKHFSGKRDTTLVCHRNLQLTISSTLGSLDSKTVVTFIDLECR
jgi:hypothetical protein